MNAKQKLKRRKCALKQKLESLETMLRNRLKAKKAAAKAEPEAQPPNYPTT